MPMYMFCLFWWVHKLGSFNIFLCLHVILFSSFFFFFGMVGYYLLYVLYFLVKFLLNVRSALGDG